MDLVRPHCVGSGFPLQGWFCPSTLVCPGTHTHSLSPEPKVDSKQMPSQGKASSDWFDPSSFFLPCFGRVVWAKAMMVRNYGLSSVWEVTCSCFT